MTGLHNDSAAFAIDSISLSEQPSLERQRRSISECHAKSLLLRGSREKRAGSVALLLFS